MKSSIRFRSKIHCFSFVPLLLFVIGISACTEYKHVSYNKESSWPLADSLITFQLGNTLANLLFTADSITCYHLIHHDSINQLDFQPEIGYVRDSLIARLLPDQKAILRYVLLSNPANYQEDTMMVQSPYLPIIEFHYKNSESHEASVIISTVNMTWTVLFDGKQQLRHSYVNDSSTQRFFEYFVEQYYR